MFVIVLAAFFVAFAASVITTLRKDLGSVGRKSRRRRPQINTVASSCLIPKGIVFWSEGDLSCSAFRHNFVSALSAYYDGPLITLDYGQRDARLNSGSWLGILLVSNRVSRSGNDFNCCSSFMLLDSTESSKEGAVALWQLRMHALGIAEMLPPIHTSLLANPNSLDLFCRQICAHLGVKVHLMVTEPSLEFVEIETRPTEKEQLISR